MEEHKLKPSTCRIAAVSVWCVVWFMALMFDQPWVAATVILVIGPLLAWLLNRSRYFN